MNDTGGQPGAEMEAGPQFAGHGVLLKIAEKRNVLLMQLGAVFEAMLLPGQRSKAALEYLNILKTNARVVVTNVRLFFPQRLRFFKTSLGPLSWNPTEYQLMHLLTHFHMAMESLGGDDNRCEKSAEENDAMVEKRRLERRNDVVLPFASVAISANSPPTMREGSALPALYVRGVHP